MGLSCNTAHPMPWPSAPVQSASGEKPSGYLRVREERIGGLFQCQVNRCLLPGLTSGSQLCHLQHSLRGVKAGTETAQPSRLALGSAWDRLT